ncbi:MAG: rRNA maturation RNase YbeY [Clostridiales bacterium]|nr:rRNA maturation RNase YbeY [Clostridiales bacterium]
MQIYFSEFNTEEQALIQKVYMVASEHLTLPNTIAVNLIMVPESVIQDMNNKYRNINKVTDVLSFPMLNDLQELENEIDACFGEVNIGDIYICREKAMQQAQEFGHSYSREVCFLALHGLLHLLGYDHITHNEEEQMFALQNQILTKAKQERD